MSDSNISDGAPVTTETPLVKEVNRSLNYQGIRIEVVTIAKNKEFKTSKAPDGKSFMIINLNVQNTLNRQIILFYDEEVRLLKEDGATIPLENYKVENNFDPGFQGNGYFLFIVDQEITKFKLEFGKQSLAKIHLDINLNQA